MEQELELNEEKKHDQEGAEPDFYVIIKDQEETRDEEYVIDYDSQRHEPIFGTDIDAAIWSPKDNKIDQFINQNNLQGVSRDGKNGDHPTQKPPL